MQRLLFRPVHRTILARLRLLPGERFLEVGCGTGNLSLAAAAVTGLAWGVDPAARMVEVARSKPAPAGARVRFLLAAAESLPFRDGTFDAAASSISMHHWVDVDAGLRELRRVLRPGARAVVADIGPRGLGKAVALLTGSRRRHQGDVWVPEELAGAVRRAGFADVRLLVGPFLADVVAFVSARVSEGR